MEEEIWEKVGQGSDAVGALNGIAASSASLALTEKARLAVQQGKSTDEIDKQLGQSTAITGGIGTLTSASSFVSAIGKYKSGEKDANAKTDLGFGLAGSGIGVASGITDMVGGGLAASGNSKGAGVAGAVSGGLGALGGVVGGISGIRDMYQAHKMRKKHGEVETDEEKSARRKKLAGGALGLLGGMIGLGGGITSLVGGVRQAQGFNNNVDTQLSFASGGLGLIGSLIGGVSSGGGLFGFL